MRRVVALVLGLLACLVLVELLVMAGQRAFIELQSRENRQALSGRDGEIRVLTIGESTTAVAGDGESRLLVPQTAYPVQLEEILRTRAPDQAWTVFNVGMMGGTTPAVLEVLEPALDAFQPHVIIAMMGIKDTPDLRLPDAGRLPWPLSDLRTVDLWLRLREDQALRRNAVAVEVDDPAELPEALRPGRSQLRKYVREVRLDEDRPEAEAIPDLELATYLWFIQRHARATEVLSRVIETHDVGRMLQARVHVTHGDADAAYAVLEEGIVRHPDEALLRVALVEALVEHGELDRADAVLSAATGGAWRSEGYAEQELTLAAARLAEARGNGPQALALLDTVDVTVDPPTDRQWWLALSTQVAVRRGSVCLALDDLDCATRALETAVAEASGDHANMWLLSKAYRKQGRFEAEADVRRQLLTQKGRLAEYMELGKLFRQQGHAEQVGLLFDEAVATIPSLRESHERLYAIARERGIHLVVMQYPSFSLTDLHKYAPPADHVSFVDNEHVFADDPDRCFHEPGFPHSFSHYTRHGAHLLAEQVADHLLTLGPSAGEVRP